MLTLFRDVPTGITWSLIRTDSAVCYSSFASTVIRNTESSFFPVILQAPYSKTYPISSTTTLASPLQASPTAPIPTANDIPSNSSAISSATSTAISHSGLQPTAKIGIGLGIPFGFLAAVVSAFVYRYRNLVKTLWKQGHDRMSPPERPKDGTPELATGYNGPQEMEEQRNPLEVEDPSMLHYSRELEGSPGPHRSREPKASPEPQEEQMASE